MTRFFDEDQQSMLEVFLYETNGLFEQLDTILMKLEQGNAWEEEDIHSIFRIMHTTKSSSSMMGLSQISQLMHNVEDLFAYLREDSQRIQHHEQEICALLDHVSNFMHHELDAMSSESFTPSDTQEYIEQSNVLLHRLQACKNNQQEDKTEIQEEKQPNEAQESFEGVYIRLRYEPDSRLENVRAYMLTTQIKPLCSMLEYYPVVLENSQDAAIWIHDHGFYIHFASEDQKVVLSLLHRALFVEKCELLTKAEYEKETFGKSTTRDSYSTEPINKNDVIASVIPVPVERLDQLQNLVGEIMISESVMKSKLESLQQKELLQVFEKQFHSIFLQLEKLTMSIRLVPISRIIPKLNRVIRDISQKEGKEITFIVTGEEIEIDKEIVDHLFDPLMHLLRNAVDHGIESIEERRQYHKPDHGSIQMQVENSNGEIIIRIIDDGRGLDIDTIRRIAAEKNLLQDGRTYNDEDIFAMVMLPGFSTKKQANEFSGRGVGMDVVKTMVDRFKGNIVISSHPHQGTTFTLHLPLTLTIVESLLFRSGTTIFSIPANHVQRFLSKTENEAGKEETGYYLYENHYLPMIDLNSFYHLDAAAHTPSSEALIYVKGSSKEACIVADSIIGYQHIVDKPLPPMLGIEFKKNSGISGCSLLGNGGICLSLNVEYLLESSMKKEEV